MKQLNNRNQLADLLNELKLTGHAAFVGVAEAQFEFYFLDRWPGKATFIDPWQILDAPGFSGHGEDTNAGQEARYQRILRQSQKYGGRCKLLRMTSEQAASKFEDGSLDFCYVDADHTVEAARNDLSLWLPKVKRGGLVSGHDYLQGNFNGQVYGVKTAVDELAKHLGVTVNVTPETWPTWYFLKP